MDMKDIGVAYHTLTDDERDTLHKVLDGIRRKDTLMRDPGTALLEAYLEGRKSLLDPPRKLHSLEIDGPRTERKVTVGVCPKCGVRHNCTP